MATTQKDVLRVLDTESNLSAVLRQRMFGGATDTYKIGVKFLDGIRFYSPDNVDLVRTGSLTLRKTAGPQLSVQYDASNKFDVSVSSAGVATLTPSGGSLVVTGTIASSALTSGVHPVAGAAGVLGNSIISSGASSATVSGQLLINSAYSRIQNSATPTFEVIRSGNTTVKTTASSSAYGSGLQSANKIFISTSDDPTDPDLLIDGPNGLITAYSDMDVQGDLTIGANTISSDGTGGMSVDEFGNLKITSDNTTFGGFGAALTIEGAVGSGALPLKWRPRALTPGLFYNCDAPGSLYDTSENGYLIGFDYLDGFVLNSTGNGDANFTTLIKAFGDETSGGYVRLGGQARGANYSEFEDDGTLKFAGNATVYKDENFDLLQASGASAPGRVDIGGTNIEVVEFNGAATLEEAHAHRELQHDYKEGTNLVFHVHWAQTTPGTGNVVWNLEYIITRSGAVEIAGGTLSVADAASGTIFDWGRVNIGTITGTDLQIGDQVSVRLYRDPTDVNDTYDGSAAVTTFGYHYELDTVGSRTITTK